MFFEAYKKALAVIAKKPLVLWGLSLMSSLIVIIAGFVCGVIPALSIAVAYLISAGMAKIYLDGLKGNEVSSEQLFSAFGQNVGRIAGALAWKDLWIIIWSLIPIVGPIMGVIKAYSYRFVPYIVMTNPDIKATEALKLSMKMTNGKKGAMFLADLCFIVGVYLITFILTLLALIPFIGIIFGFILFIFLILLVALCGIFVGLYQASFFEEATATLE